MVFLYLFKTWRRLLGKIIHIRAYLVKQYLVVSLKRQKIIGFLFYGLGCYGFLAVKRICCNDTSLKIQHIHQLRNSRYFIAFLLNRHLSEYQTIFHRPTMH